MKLRNIIFVIPIFFVFLPDNVFAQTSTPTPILLQSYTVQKGDAFSDIVGALLKDSSLGTELLRFNSMNSPDQIYPGQVLLVPPDGVLVQLKGKNDSEIQQIRQSIQDQTTPVVVASLQPSATPSVTPSTTVSTGSTQAGTNQSATGSPTPTKTPTLKISGSKTINISYGQSSGAGVTGISNIGYDRHESLRLNIEGQLNDQVKIVGHYAQSDLALEDEYDLTLTAGHWEAFFGNFGISLPGSQYLSSGMSSTGIRVKGTYDTWDVVALYGTPRGRIIYDKFYGNNTQGPYTLSANPITPGTETVMLDKQALTRGTDYQIDYTLGQVTLKRVVYLTDLLEVQYQSRSALFNTQDYGYHADVMLMGSKDGKGPKWTIGQGYLREAEQPDPNITTATAKAATDTHMLDLDSTLDLGPVLKISGETAYSILVSSNTAITPTQNGGAYRLQADSFQGPFHFLGKYSKTDPSFSSIGNPVMSNDFQEWTLSGDFKTKDGFFGQLDRTFQKTNATGNDDETTTDHGELKAQPKGFPSFDYAYYNSNEVRNDPTNPFSQDSLRHSANLTFALPAKLSFKAGGEYQEQNGSNTGDIKSRGANAALSSEGWKGFNFSISGDWKLNDVLEASSNTTLPQTQPGNDIFSQTYTLAMEGKPIDHFSLTAKALYSSDPPGPPRTNVAASYQTDPLKWLTSSGNYTLEFDQRQVLNNNVSDQVHSASGNVDLNFISWWKLSFQPSIRVEILPDYGQEISENTHWGFRSSLNPSFGTLSGDYANDNFRNWDTSTVGFPFLFTQNTIAWEVAGKKGLTSNLSLTAGYKRSDQNQVNYAAATISSQTQTTNQNENDSLAWAASKELTFTFSHNYNQLNQSAPGQPIAQNPLLPNGPDSFSVNFPVNSVNVFTEAHTFTLRVTEQLSKSLSVYEEGDYTATTDVLQGGSVQTYSPAAGFTWKASSFLNWSGSYQYNGSSGEVATQIQKAQTTLSASLNTQTTLALNWSWSKASNPDLINQQGNMSFTMGF